MKAPFIACFPCLRFLEQPNQEPIPTSNQWIPPEFSTCNNFSTLGATSMSQQDSPPTYDAAMADDPHSAGGWTKPN